MTEPAIAVAPLGARQESEWEKFLTAADHASLFHDLRFLAYHRPGRFRFHHLVARRAGEIVAALPGALVAAEGGVWHVSPVGASVGGPALKGGLASKDLLALVAAFQAHARAQGWAGMEMTLPPPLYHANPSDTLPFALYFHSFRLANRWLCPAVPISSGAAEQYRGLFRETYANRVRAARAKGMRAGAGGSECLDDFLAVFRDSYGRHGAAATHSEAEIADLLRRLPDRIKLFTATLDGAPAAGILLFLLNPRVAYSFYICMSDALARASGNLVLFAFLIDWLAERGYRWLDLGPSAHAANFNEGVTFFKEGLGAIGHCRDRWRWTADG
jgi:hypothetical protein